MANVQGDLVYGGDFRVGSPSHSPSIIIVGDSRAAGMGYAGAMGTPYSASLTPPNFGGKAFSIINRAAPSLSVRRLLKDPVYDEDFRSKISGSVPFSNTLALECVGPMGLNDLVQENRSISPILDDIEAYCQFRRSQGVKVVLISEISCAITNASGVSGDDLKNAMHTWLTTGGQGSERWRSFADAVVLPGYVAPFGQHTSGAYGPSGCGSHNSTHYVQDSCHLSNAGSAWLANVPTYGINAVLNALISSLAPASIDKAAIPSFLDIVAMVKDQDQRLAALESSSST